LVLPRCFRSSALRACGAGQLATEYPGRPDFMVTPRGPFSFDLYLFRLVTGITLR
jgi:hypothetical protein